MIDFTSDSVQTADVSDMARQIPDTDATTLFDVKAPSRRAVLVALLSIGIGVASMSGVAFGSTNTVPTALYQGYNEDVANQTGTVFGIASVMSEHGTESESVMRDTGQKVKVIIHDEGYEPHTLSADEFGEVYEPDDLQLIQPNDHDSESVKVIIEDKGYEPHALTGWGDYE